jgi:hypothetical protein
MKHIKKKYQFRQNLELPDDSPLVKVDYNTLNQEVLKANHRKNNLLIQSEENDIYLGFIYNNSGTYIPIALPDFTLVYFDFAYNLNRNRQEVKRSCFLSCQHKTQ